jgi:Acyl-CoA dehydrogenase, C-terminal domain
MAIRERLRARRRHRRWPHSVDRGDRRIAADGFPEWRIAMLPAERYEILDTWDTTGLRATTIASMAASFRPSTFTFRDQPRDGALYAWPGLFIARLNGVSLGIAAGALEAAESMVADKVLMPERRPARDDTRVRTDIARAEALVGSARSYAIDVIGDVWATLKAGDEPSRRQRAALAGTTSTPHERVVRQCNW